MIKKNSILQGDCLKLLEKIPSESIDLIFADPPYNLQLRETLYRPDQTAVEAVTNDWDKFESYQSYDDFSIKWLTECKRILKNNGSINLRTGVLRLIDDLFRNGVKQFIVTRNNNKILNPKP